jgi:hypothetical protein
MYSEALREKLWQAFLADGLASHYVDFEPWCRIRSIALNIIATHKE